MHALAGPALAGDAPQAVPYVGLRPFLENQEPYFFGRDREREIIAFNLLASRLTILYGPSGVGKSSVLQAGVIPDLRRRAADGAEDGVPEYAVVLFNNWRDDPVAGLIDAVRAGVARASDGPASESRSASLVETLQTEARRFPGGILIVLDQFDEYFLYDAGDDRFASEFAQAVNHPDLDVSFLVSIREDAYAKLDRFKGRISRLFENYLRIDHLGPEAARQAIRGPVDRHNALNGGSEPVALEDALVEAVLEGVEAGRLTMVEAGTGGVEKASASPNRPIEASHLQLVMARLWEEERGQGSRRLRVETLERLGGAQEIVHAHLDQALSTLSPTDRDVAARAFKHLVTPSGTKIAYSVADLAAYTELKKDELEPVLRRLALGDGAMRVLRSVAPAPGQVGDRYEIFHDTLGAAVLAWRVRHAQAQELRQAAETLDRERQQAHLRARQARRRAIAWGSLAAAVATIFAVVAVSLTRAQREGAKADSRRWAASAMSSLAADPLRSVGEAERALDKAWTREAEEALRVAMAAPQPAAVMRHDNQIWTTSFSADGRQIVTGSTDTTARIWDAATGAELAVLKGHIHNLLSASFSPDGTRVVTTSQDHTARIWDAGTGDEIHPLDLHEDQVTSAVFSPRGDQVVTASWDGTARVWDASTAEPLSVVRPDDQVVVGLSTDGRWAVSVGTGGAAAVWDTKTGARIADLPRAGEEIDRAIFSPDGRLVAIGGVDGGVLVWPWLGGEPQRPPAHTGRVQSMEFSGTGRYLATSGDKAAHVWDVEARRTAATLQGHIDFVLDVTMSPDETRVATASGDGAVKVWDRASGSVLRRLGGHPDAVADIAFSPGGDRIVTAGVDGTARLWELPGDSTFGGHSGWVLSARYSSDDRLVVTAGADGTTRVWEASTGRQLSAFGDGAEVNDAAFSRDGQHVVTVTADSTARVFDWRTGAEVTRKALGFSPRAVDVHPAGDLIVIGATDDGVAYLWPWRSGSELRPLGSPNGNDAVYDVGFSPDGRRVVTAGSDGTARVWDPSTGRQRAVLRGHGGRVYSAEFSHDGRRIVTTSGDRTVKVWDAASGKPKHTMEGNESGSVSASFSADDDLVVVGFRNGFTGVWDVSGDRPRHLSTFQRHGDFINTATFTNTGRMILTASDDHTARMYACELCVPLEELRHKAREQLRRVGTAPAVGRNVSSYDLEEGNCYNRPAAEESFSQVTLIDCGEPHDREVFAVITHPAPHEQDYDAEELEKFGDQECRGRHFENFVGEQYEESRFEATFLYPTSYSWARGDREVACLLYEEGRKVSGSAKGTAS